MTIDENVIVRIMYSLLAQFGVKIDSIQDNKVVNFSVPSMSDFTAQKEELIALDGVPAGEPIAGELLLIMANSFFENNGLKPNGRIRSEYWTHAMGAAASLKIQKTIENEEPCLL